MTPTVPEMLERKKCLVGRTLVHRAWRESRPAWDHDHCEFCWVTFCDDPRAKNALKEGYCTPEEYYWICEACVARWKEPFQWTIHKEDRPPTIEELRAIYAIPNIRSPGRKLAKPD